MDVKEKIESLVAKIKGNKDLLAKFKKDPTETVKGLVGEEVPADVLEKIVSGVKGRLAAGKLSGAFGSLGSIFKKKG